jgi:hypothetical protein
MDVLYSCSCLDPFASGSPELTPPSAHFHLLVVPTPLTWASPQKIPSIGGVDVRRSGWTGWVPFRESFPLLKPTPGIRPSPPSEGNRFHPIVVPAELASLWIPAFAGMTMKAKAAGMGDSSENPLIRERYWNRHRDR